MPMALKLKKTPAHGEQLDHSRLTSLINSMADAVIALDKQSKVVLYNGAALNILDVNSIRTGVSIHKLFQPIDRNKELVDIRDLIKTADKPTTNRDLRLSYTDGSIINLYISIAPVHLGYGEAGQEGYVLLLRDITREKSLEEERDEFISVVSHELRTPIAISEGNISNAEFIVNKTGDIQAVKDALKAAHDQILFLADMINDLSTLSRAERGVLKVEPEPINVHELLNQLTANYEPHAKQKNLAFHVEQDPKLELLQSSKLYVREVLQNFITNALKYTQRGSVTLGGRVKPGGVEFYISDTGIGISKSDQDRVFDKFFRSEDYRTRETNGTGLGLYVTAKLARLIKADISLKSELNVGSTFTIFVPNLPDATAARADHRTA
jgi:PAS domain S-box-containing protein